MPACVVFGCYCNCLTPSSCKWLQCAKLVLGGLRVLLRACCILFHVECSLSQPVVMFSSSHLKLQVFIQSVWRRFCQQRQYRGMRRVAVWGQASIRGRIARKDYLAQKAAAVLLSAQFRGFSKRSEYSKQRAAVRHTLVSQHAVFYCAYRILHYNAYRYHAPTIFSNNIRPMNVIVEN